MLSQKTVSAHKYNTADNFIRFYRAFKKSKMDTLELFYRQYQPPITPCHYTCVGLAYELIRHLNTTLPKQHDAIDRFFVASCEEIIETVPSYVGNVPPDRKSVEKEHVMVCLKLQIGSRKGFLVLDPGYHVSRVVTVMEDCTYPHTGRFVQSDDGRVKKEYDYTMSTQEYISWFVAETKRGVRQTHTSLIFTGRPFLSAIDVAERRNLAYDFKSVLRRDPKGRLIAGLYFSLDPEHAKLTLFYMENNNRVDVKLNMVKNVKDTKEIRECEEQMGLKKGKLLQKLNTVGRIVHDDAFIAQLLELNEKIVCISAEN